MKILHGEDTAASRAQLTQIKQEHQRGGNPLVSFNGKDLDVLTLQAASQSVDLLGGVRLIVIEGFFGAPKSKRQDEVFAYLATVPKDDQQILLWESKKVAPTKLKALNAQVTEFNLPKIIFTFLENVVPGQPWQTLKLFKSILATQPAELVFFMLVRQTRLLLTAKFAPQTLKGPGWITGKIKGQAGKFSPTSLLGLHESLYQIDKEIKTGQSLLPLPDRLSSLLLVL